MRPVQVAPKYWIPLRSSLARKLQYLAATRRDSPDQSIESNLKTVVQKDRTEVPRFALLSSILVRSPR